MIKRFVLCSLAVFIGCGGGSGGSTPTPAVVIPVTLDLTIGKVQLNQAIQLADDSVPIISSRALVFRVYPLANEFNTAKPVIKVDVYSGTTLVQTVSGTFPNSAVPIMLDLNSSNVVELQVSASSVANGYTYTVTVDSTGVVSETNKNNNTFTRTISAVTTHSLPLNIVPLKIGSVVSTLTTVAKVQADYGQNNMSMMPVSNINYTVSPVYTVSTPVVDPAALTNVELGKILAEVEQKRLAESSGVPYIGYYLSQGAHYSGLAYVPGWTCLVQEGSAATVHEITHMFGIGHVGCTSFVGTESGYPYANGTVPGNTLAINGFKDHLNGISPLASTKYDYMTYCYPTWPSDWTYKRLFNSINSKWPSGTNKQSDNSEVESILISGTYDTSSDKWELGPAFTLSKYLDSTTEDWTDNGLEIRVLDKNGKVIGKKNFKPNIYGDGDLQVRSFAVRFNGDFENAYEIQVVELDKVVAIQRSGSSKAAMVMNENGEVLTVLRNSETITGSIVHVSNGVRSKKVKNSSNPY